MPGMWLHALATALMVAHVALVCRRRTRRVAALCGDVVMILVMLDMTAGVGILPPVAWFGFTVVTALAIALTNRGGRAAADEVVDTAGSWAHGALALILLGAVQLVASPHAVGVETGAHQHAAPATLLPFLVIALAVDALVSVVEGARVREARARASRLLTAGAALAMGAALVVG